MNGKYRIGRGLLVPAAIILAALACATPAVAGDSVKTKLALLVLDPGVETGFVAGELSSTEKACTKGRKVEALARHAAGGGETKSLSDGRFQIPLGVSEQIPQTGGYEVTALRKRIGSGKNKKVCEEATADVRFVDGELDRFDFDYGDSAFTGTLGSPEQECAGPYRSIEVTKYPSGEYVGSAYTDENGGWTVSTSGPVSGQYQARVGSTFGAPQHQRKNGNLEVVGCLETYVWTEIG